MPECTELERRVASQEEMVEFKSAAARAREARANPNVHPRHMTGRMLLEALSKLPPHELEMPVCCEHEFGAYTTDARDLEVGFGLLVVKDQPKPEWWDTYMAKARARSSALEEHGE